MLAVRTPGFIGYQQLGQILENGGCYYLPKMVGLGRALEFAYTGHLDAQRAYEWGLLNYLVPCREAGRDDPRAVRTDHAHAAIGAMDQQADHAGGPG